MFHCKWYRQRWYLVLQWIVTVYTCINLIKYSYLFCSSVHPHIYFLVFYMFYKTIPSSTSRWRQLLVTSSATFLVLFFIASMFTQHTLASCVMKKYQKNFLKNALKIFILSHLIASFRTIPRKESKLCCPNWRSEGREMGEEWSSREL